MSDSTDTPKINEVTGLVEGWEVKHSRTRQLPYYYHAESQTSSWEPPAGSDPDKLKKHIAKHYSEKTVSNEQAAGGADQAGKIRASHLLIKHKDSRRPSSWKEAHITRTKDEAMSIILAHEARIRSGQSSLAELAVSESDCSSARRSGDLGYFGKGEMQKEFEDAAFALKVGEVSGVVETQSGLHLIERTG
ncbi:peptidyl-prolyl cis-trans isomerase Ess1p [Trichomonascus vanleenenianus]|uniref:peptidylprolyl isomerase ESS1 n=1 Tax=Trichomonascus vanleenenianus TaxID=2268995 RepID=UPI003ECA9CB2